MGRRNRLSTGGESASVTRARPIDGGIGRTGPWIMAVMQPLSSKHINLFYIR